MNSVWEVAIAVITLWGVPAMVIAAILSGDEGLVNAIGASWLISVMAMVWMVILKNAVESRYGAKEEP